MTLLLLLLLLLLLPLPLLLWLMGVFTTTLPEVNERLPIFF